MCSLAPRAAAPACFGATAFLDRQRGVAAAAMAAPAATSGHKAGVEPARRARAFEETAALARKRGRHDAGFEHVVVDRPAASSELRVRMDKELVALQGLLKRAKLLPRSAAAPAENKQHEAAPSSAAKRTTSSQFKAAITEAPACHQQAQTAPAANSKQQQRPVQRASAKNYQIAPEVTKKKQQPAEAQAAAAAERRPEEEEREKKLAARAAEREAFRQMLLEVEKSARPDQTISPEELKALGIPFEFVVTRTWKQACLDYQQAKKKKLSTSS